MVQYPEDDSGWFSEEDFGVVGKGRKKRRRPEVGKRKIIKSVQVKWCVVHTLFLFLLCLVLPTT